jgi:hypothetical protein
LAAEVAVVDEPVRVTAAVEDGVVVLVLFLLDPQAATPNVSGMSAVTTSIERALSVPNRTTRTSSLALPGASRFQL